MPDKKIDPFPKKIPSPKVLTASHTFVVVLALVSIIGFIGIVSSTLFEFDLSFYAEGAMMIIMGVGFVLEGDVRSLWYLRKIGLTPKNFANVTTVVIGIIAFFAGILSIPPIRIEHHGFLAVKGILSVIAIVIIVIQTWIVESPN